MSAEGPESVPTSADPRSRRPAKKRALAPSSVQAASLEALFAKPDREIRIPPPPPASGAGTVAARPARPPPPEIVTNVQGSSAGAGSGEFHVYKASRRREYERLRDMDAQLRREKDGLQFERDRAERERKDDEKTRKNRERREKAKARKSNKAKGAVARDDAAPASPAAAATAIDADVPSGTRADPSTTTLSHAPDSSNRGKTATQSTAGLIIHDDD